MTFLVVPDDDTLRAAIKEAIGIAAGSARIWHREAADAVMAVLRDVGTPATTETVAQSMAETAARVSVGSAVTYAEVLDALMAAAGYVPRVTDWTETQP